MSDRALLVAALTADDRLDDITRARMWSRIEDRIAAPSRARRWPYAAAALAAAAAAALLVIVLRRPSAADVPAGATLTTHVGPYTRAAIIGPARWQLVDAGEVTQVRVTHGTFLADFTGGPGRALHIDAPRMRVEVVGTLLGVEVLPASTCVSVAHGRVRAIVAGRVTYVSGGQRLCAGDGTAHGVAPLGDRGPIEPQMQRTLEAHAALLAQLEEPAPAAASAAAPVPAPVSAAAPAPAPAAVLVPVPAAAPAATHPRAALPAAPTSTTKARPDHATAPASASVPAAATAPAAIAVTAPEPAPSQPPAPTPPAPANPAPTPPPPPTADELYARAESALARRDLDAADRALAQIEQLAPGAGLGEQATFERARIAYERRAWTAARAHLAKLDRAGDAALRESARYLMCRIAVESHDRDASACLTAFRAAYPQSAHDRDSLGALTTLAYAAGGCGAAKTQIGELVARYPHSALAAAWRAKCPEAP